MLDEIEYERLLYEDYVTDIDITSEMDKLYEAAGIKYKNSKDLKDKRKVDNTHRNKLIAALHNTPQYQEKVRGMGEKERILFDSEISKLVSAYFPSIKEYWIKNNCSEVILTQYALSTLTPALGLVSLAKVRKAKLNEYSFINGDRDISEEYDITRPKIKLYKEEYHKPSFSMLIDNASSTRASIPSID